MEARLHPLHVATGYGYLGVVNLLLDRHTDLRLTDEEGQTALRRKREVKNIYAALC